MSPDLLSRLYWTWTQIFRLHPAPGSRAEFGCNCGDGWFPLVDTLCLVLSDRADSLDRHPPEILDINEERGGLSINARTVDDPYLTGAIRLAERLSWRICEISGKPGRLYAMADRFRTLSPEVASAEGYQRVDSHIAWVTDAMLPLPPLPRPDVARLLEGHWQPYLRCEPDLPGGWLRIADAVLEQFSVRPRCACAGEAYVEQLRESLNGIVLCAVTNSLEDRGAIALARALATRTDPETGGMS